MYEKIFRTKIGVYHAAGMDVFNRFGRLKAPLFASREAYIIILKHVLLEAAVTGLSEEKP
jgi:hypothetical protein